MYHNLDIINEIDANYIIAVVENEYDNKRLELQNQKLLATLNDNLIYSLDGCFANAESVKKEIDGTDNLYIDEVFGNCFRGAIMVGIEDDPDTTEEDSVKCTNEDWDCDEWNSCSGGNQTRVCTDNNDCGTTLDKPVEIQNCEDGSISQLNCGYIPPNLASDDEFLVPKYKCISDNLKECDPTILTWDVNNQYGFIYLKKTDSNNCKVNYKTLGLEKECIFPISFLEEMHGLALSEGVADSLIFVLMTPMSIESFGKSSGDTFEFADKNYPCRVL